MVCNGTGIGDENRFMAEDLIALLEDLHQSKGIDKERQGENFKDDPHELASFQEGDIRRLISVKKNENKSSGIHPNFKDKKFLKWSRGREIHLRQLATGMKTFNEKIWKPAS